MTKLKADLTKTPEINTSDLGGSASNAIQWTGAVAVMVALAGVAVAIGTMLRNRAKSAVGMSSDGSGYGGFWEGL